MSCAMFVKQMVFEGIHFDVFIIMKGLKRSFLPPARYSLLEFLTPRYFRPQTDPASFALA